MKTKLNARGETNLLLAPVIVLGVLFIAAALFAFWAFSGRQDYKNNVDAKIIAANAENTKEVQAQDAKTYAEAAKNPLKNYAGPDAYGSIRVSYPKTWSLYVDSSNNPVDAYFHVDYVPATSDKTAVYNLRVQVQNSSYDDVVQQYQNDVQSGKATATPYKLPKVSSVTGLRFDGQVFDNDSTTGSVIVLPIRDKTLLVWEQTSAYAADFNNIILPNLTFSP